MQGGRAELFITSKVWNDAHRPAELRQGRVAAGQGRLEGRCRCGAFWSALVRWPYIATKCLLWSPHPAPCRKSVEQSVSELGCSYLDLCLVHWPDAFKPGSEEPDTEVTLQQTW